MINEALLTAMFDEQAKKFRLGLEALSRSGITKWLGFACVGVYRLFWDAISKLTAHILMSAFYVLLGMTLLVLSLQYPEAKTALDVLSPDMQVQAIASASLVVLGWLIAVNKSMATIFLGALASFWYSGLVLMGVLSGAITFLGITAVITVLFGGLGLASSASQRAKVIELQGKISELSVRQSMIEARAKGATHASTPTITS